MTDPRPQTRPQGRKSFCEALLSVGKHFGIAILWEYTVLPSQRPAPSQNAEGCSIGGGSAQHVHSARTAPNSKLAFP